jgi:hypothetical protein
LIDCNDAKIKAHAAKYRDAREALMKLQGADEVTFGWCKLEDKDIRCMEDPEKIGKDEARREARREREELKNNQADKRKKTKDQTTATGGPGVGEGRRTVSWLFIDSETGEGSMQGVYEGNNILLHETTTSNWLLYIQQFGLNGQRPGLAHVAGQRKSYLLGKKCGESSHSIITWPYSGKYGGTVLVTHGRQRQRYWRQAEMGWR